MLQPGQAPEDFTLLDDAGNEVAWSSFRGRPVAVFFYPKASTPGCTKEACAFTDLRAEFEALGVAVLGMSADTVRRQANFKEKYELSMPLISDPDHVVLKPWGVWGLKKNYGREYEGIIRSTFLFDADGKVAHVWSPVRVKGHAEAVLEKARELFGQA